MGQAYLKAPPLRPLPYDPKEVVVTYHAILRWLERVHDIDISWMRNSYRVSTGSMPSDSELLKWLSRRNLDTTFVADHIRRLCADGVMITPTVVSTKECKLVIDDRAVVTVIV